MHKYLSVIGVLLLSYCTGLNAQAFRDVTEEVGIDARAVDPNLMGGGVVWFDYNGDYYPDLLFLNGELPLQLYANNWDGTFTDVTESTRLTGVLNVMGAVSADFDADGHQDLFFTTFDGTPCRLFRNTGTGRFQDISAAAGITQFAYSASAAVGDPDGDGDPDIYVANYLAGPLPQDGGQANFFYQNNGDGTFTENAAALHLDDMGCGLGVIFSDLDQDGREDLYVANDFGYLIQANELYRNTPDGFEATAMQDGSAATINAMGIAKGDYDNDGDTDLYITNIRENPLFENIDSARFFDYASFRTGVALPDLTSWGTSFTDFDLDGWLDLIVVNGQVAEQDNEAEPMTYFGNTGTGQFTDNSAMTGIGSIELIGRGLAVADYDLDGLPDLAVQAVQATTTGTEQARLIRNTSTTTGSWLAVVPPFGALQLSLHTQGQVVYRETDGGSSYLSHANVPLHFGAMNNGAIDSLVVSYRDGTRQVYEGITWNRLVGLRKMGSWFTIRHEVRINCAAEERMPELEQQLVREENGREQLRIIKTVTVAYERLPDQVIELTEGDVFRNVARTQDAVIVDTLANSSGCPRLQPILLRVTPERTERDVFPNPVVDRLTIGLTSRGGSIAVDLFTMSGALAFRQIIVLENDSRQTSISLRHLPRGAYLCRIRHHDQITYHKLIRP